MGLILRLAALIFYLLSISSVLVGIFLIGVGLSGQDILSVGSFIGLFIGAAFILFVALIPTILFYLIGSNLRKRAKKDSVSDVIIPVQNSNLPSVPKSNLPSVPKSNQPNVPKSNQPNVPKTSKFESVTLEDLSLAPEKYEGRFVAVSGFASRYYQKGKDLFITESPYKDYVYRFDVDFSTSDVEYRKLAANSYLEEITVFGKVVNGRLDCSSAL
jgi:hypothetical protein